MQARVPRRPVTGGRARARWRLRGEAARLLGACAAAGPAERRIAIWDRQLSASAVALMGSIEISVHGWDISVACGARRPGLFAAPVRLPAPACPGDQLVAFLSRRPHPPDTSAPGRTWRSGLASPKAGARDFRASVPVAVG